MSKKYILHPGFIESITDGQKHYITSDNLMRLYGVNPKECVTFIPYRQYPNQDKLIQLHPNIYGDYILPKGDDNV